MNKINIGKHLYDLISIRCFFYYNLLKLRTCIAKYQSLLYNYTELIYVIRGVPWNH